MAVVLRLLGEVVLDSSGRRVDLGSPRQRCVLAALAVDAGRTVPVALLVRRVWGEDSDQRSRATLHGYVSRLRRALAAVEGIGISRRNGGYELTVDAATVTVDLSAFRRLRDRALRADDGKTELLGAALEWCGGEPLGGLSGMWVETERDRLRHECLAVQHDLVDAQLLGGGGPHLLSELSAKVADEPLDERVAAQYMRALHQAGRTAQALEEYRRTRQRLVAELGTEPGPVLRSAHQHVLRRAAVEPQVASVAGVPRQLPATPVFFVGRGEELSLLDTAATASGTQAVVVTMAGAGGMGKTWLAVHWAQRHAERFTDGQLFINLHGFSPTEKPLTPGAVLGGFLTALGVAGARLPVEEHARSALFRSLVSGKRMLLVLDNAVDTAQVLPLLPGANSCLVLVTSRNTLTGLITAHGATHLPVDVLPEPAALDLLGARLGDRVVRADDAAARDVARCCGGYPLALAIVAGRVQTEPGLALRVLAAELRERTVEALHSGDPTASISAALATSWHALDHAQVLAFQLLAIAPGPDIGPQAAAHLLGLPPGAADDILRELARASLISRSDTGRYRIHDLIRHHATRSARELPEELRTAAERRVIDYYVHTARAAHALIYTSDVRVPFEAPSADCCPHPPSGTHAAFDWFEAEHSALLAAQQTAITLGWDAVVWRIAYVVSVFQQLRNNLHDQFSVWLAALAAGQRLGDQRAQMHAHWNVGYTQAKRGVHEKAVEHLERAHDLAQAAGDPAMAALIVRIQSMSYEQHKDIPTAATHAERAVRLSRELGDSVELARALSGFGWYLALLEHFDDADRYCREGWDLFQQFPDLSSEARVLASLGYIAYRRGEHVESIAYYYRALEMVRGFDYIYAVAISLSEVGDPLAALGRYDEVRVVWHEAIDLFRQEGCVQQAADLKQRFDALPRPPGNRCDPVRFDG